MTRIYRDTLADDSKKLEQLCRDVHGALILGRLHSDGEHIKAACELLETAINKIGKLIPLALAAEEQEAELDEARAVLDGMTEEELGEYLAERQKEVA